MRYPFLICISAYGGFVAYLSRIDETNLVAVLNCLVFYAVLVLVYLGINRMKEWRFLLIYSLMVIGFVVELMIRGRA